MFFVFFPTHAWKYHYVFIHFFEFSVLALDKGLWPKRCASYQVYFQIVTVGRVFVRGMPVKRTPVKNLKNALDATSKVGANRNMSENDVDGSGDEVEGGTMLMAIEGIVEESRGVERVAGVAQAPKQAQAPTDIAYTQTHTNANTLPHTAGVKRTYAQTVSPKGQETPVTGSGVGLGPGPVGALTLTLSH
jgi:hypothetical protein